MWRRVLEKQEYESRQLNDMEVDVDKNKEEFSFIPSAVNSSAGWHEPKFTCDRSCRETEYQYFEIASVMVQSDGAPHAIDLRINLENWRHGEKRNQLFSQRAMEYHSR